MGLSAGLQEELFKAAQQQGGRCPCVTLVAYFRSCYLLQEYAGIVTMAATTDHAQKSVLMLSNVRDRSIKLLELPAFSERGVLPDVSVPPCCADWWEARTASRGQSSVKSEACCKRGLGVSLVRHAASRCIIDTFGHGVLRASGVDALMAVNMGSS